MIERRRYHRLVYNIEVEYNKASESHAVFVEAQSVNISSGGIRVVCLEKIKVGDNLNLRFSLPDGKEVISAKGVVIWLEKQPVGYDAGIEFTSIQDTDRARIKQFVYKATKQ